MVLISPGTYTNIVEHKLTEHFFGERVVTVEFLPGTDGVLVRVTFDAETTHPVERQARWLAGHSCAASFAECALDINPVIAPAA